MPRRKTSTKAVSPVPPEPVADYRYDATRKNIPPAGLAAQGRLEEPRRIRYEYNPHRPPLLRFDPSGAADRLPELITTARERALTDAEARLLADALRTHQPWLEWAGKREQTHFEVEPVALHIHERIAAQAIVKMAARQDVQRDLFAEPKLSYREAVQFYQHPMDWANRMILGDSLQVMTSLARREDLAGKVQMIYVDPPYGIKFASNFQPEVGKRDVKDKESDLTREPEMVKAYQDTWTLGVHSYLTYLRDRLWVAKELLADTGSIFVQISDENLHRVRMVMDEVFGAEQFVSLISFQTTSGFAESGGLSRMGDYLLWYSKSREQTKIRTVFEQQEIQPGTLAAGWLITPDGDYRGVSTDEEGARKPMPEGVRLYKPDNLQSQGASSTPQPFEFQGRLYAPGPNNHWKPNYPLGLSRLAQAGRVHVAKNSIQYRRYADDFPLKARGNLWTDTLTGSFTEAKFYVVQTNPKVIERCLLMTTDPGDLVLDPTCGSGTTAYVAEQWGRRWITIDTSRVALALARQRLMTAQFDYYELRPLNDADCRRKPSGAWLSPSPPAPLPGAGEGSREAGGEGRYTLGCESVPHITLKSIAQNAALDAIFVKHQPVLDDKLRALNAALAGALSSSSPLPAGEGSGVRVQPRHYRDIPSDLRDFARQLRTSHTDAEALIWYLLRDRRLAGFKFRRQHPVPPYVLDFYCHERKLAIELDGGQHQEQQERDDRRSAFLAQRGIRVLRFWNNDVLVTTEEVLAAIWQALHAEEGALTPGPSPANLAKTGGRGENLRQKLAAKLAAKQQAEGKRAITEADRRRWLLPPANRDPKVKLTVDASFPGWYGWEVPFDADPDWPRPLTEALTAYRAAWRAKMDEVNSAIAASAENEELVDRPRVRKGVVRVSGPFTMEAVMPVERTLDDDSPIEGVSGELDGFTAQDAPANAEAFLDKMIRLLAQDGVRFPNNKVTQFQRLSPIGEEFLHAEGEWADGEGRAQTVAVSIGPEFGPVTAYQVENALHQAARRGYANLVLAGFSFDAAAQAIIQDDPNPRVHCHLAHIRPDVNMSGLLKVTPNAQLFTVFGSPRTRLEQGSDGLFTVTLEGVDIYNPVENTIIATSVEKVAAWFIDSDYDGRTFCITQAFFPDKTAWEKLARALKAVVDAAAFAALSGTTSLPFAAGEHKRVAVKVIDPRGNEVMRVHRLDGGYDG